MRRDELPLEGNCGLLRQGMALLESLSDAMYAERRGAWAPVGAQYRHVLEHYRSFFQGLPIDRIDYDDRPRDEHLEQSRQAALQATLDCLEQLTALGDASDRPLLVRMDSGDGPDRPDWRPSSAGRELQFLSSHTVHHFALIRLLLERDGGQVDPDLGLAPATLAHQRQHAG